MDSDQVWDVFGLFGPGVVYSHNTLQNFLDFFMRIDSTSCVNQMPFVIQTAKKQTNADIDQLVDLDDSREFILKIFEKFLVKKNDPLLEVLERDQPARSLASQISRLFLFPAMQLVIPSDPAMTERAVSSLSQFFQGLGSTWNGENDEPEVSRTLVHQMANILMGSSVSEAVAKEICQLWINFFHSRGVIEDFLMLAAIVARKRLKVDIDVSSVVASIRDLVEKPRFLNSLKDVESTTMYVGRLNYQKSCMSNSTMEISQRRAAAHYGFLFVLDPRFGLVKIGTGQCSTVFTSLEVENGDYTGVVAQSMAVAGHCLLMRQDKCKYIEIIDMITLHKVGYFLADGTYSCELRETEVVIPEGPFTGFMNRLYFVHDSTLNIFEIKDLCLVLVKKVALQAEKSSGFETPVPSVSSSIITLVTNGDSIALFYPANYAKRPCVTIREFAIDDGKLVADVPYDKLLSSCICFDETCDALYDVPDHQGPVIYSMPPNFLSPYRFQTCTATDDPVLQILNALPTLLAMRLSRTKYDERLKYVISDTDAVYEAVKVCLVSDSSFVRPITQMMYLHLMQFKDEKPPSADLVCSLLNSRYLEPMDRVFLVRAVFSMREKLSDIDSVLNVVSPKLFIDATMTFREFGTQTLLAIFNFSDKLISYAVKTFDHPCYSFLQLVTISVMKCVFRDATLDASYILAILQMLVPMHSHLFLSLMATMLPLLRVSLENELSFVSSLAVFPQFLREMHMMTPQNALKDYAISHIAMASEQPFTVQTVIDETPHPYDNNMDYERHYDFPSAVEITITFDPRSKSEANCDWLQIFTDKDCTKKLTEKLSGATQQKWKDKIVTTAKHLTFKFHSDGSVNDWGYLAQIQAKLFGRMNYTSPNMAYDVFRNFFDILLKVMKKCDSTTCYVPGPTSCAFKFDDNTIWENVKRFRAESLSLEAKQQLAGALNDKFGTSLSDDFARSMTVVQTALVYHLVHESEATPGQQQFVQHIVTECPLSVIFFRQSDLAEHFSNLANLMLFYIPQGIPDSELDFLYKSLKGTKSAENFVRDSLEFAENAFKEPELNLPSICYAVNKAALAFQLLQEPNYDKFWDIWFSCLTAMGRVRACPNSTLTPTSLETVLDFGCMFGDAFGDGNRFVKKHLEILTEIEINTPDTDIPVVKLILNRLLLLKTVDIDGQIMRDIVVSVLQFNLPNVIALVSELIDKFNIQLVRVSDDVVGILKGIGTNYRTQSQEYLADSIEDIVWFDAGVTFACAKAECVRKMLREEVLGDLVPLLQNNDDDVKLAVLLVLSCRSFQLRPCHSVMIPDLGMRATLKSLDIFRYVLETEQGGELILPAFDFRTISRIQVPFQRVLPELFQNVTKELPLAVAELLDSKFRPIAFNALLELLSTNELPWGQLFRQLERKQEDSNIPIQCKPHELTEFPEMTKMLKVKNADLVAYRYNEPISAYSFSMTPMDAQLGFCDFDNPAPGSALLFTCSEKSVMFDNKVIADSEAIRSLTVGYVPDGMRLFLIINNQVKFTDFYLPPMIKPIPVVVISGNKESKFDSSPVIDLPLFCSKTPVPGQQPSHMFVADRSIRLDSIYSPLPLKLAEHSNVELLPALSKCLPYYYIEFAFTSVLTTISLRPTSHRAFSFYTYEVREAQPNDTLGLFINFKEGYAFVTLNAEILEDSTAELEMHDWIITFGVDTMESVFVNIGQFPFMFDADAFFANPHGKIGEKRQILPERTNFVLTSPLPTPYVDRDLFTLSVFGDTQPRFHGFTSIRPCIINTSEKGSYYNGKVGFGTYSTSNNVTLLVGNDDSCTVSQISFPTNNVVSMVDEISATLSDSQKIYQRLISQVPMELCRGLSPFGKGDGFFLDSRRSEFFDKQIEQQRAKIMNYCMLKIIEQYGLDHTIAEFGLEEFLVNSITQVDCNDFDPFRNLDDMCYAPVLHMIFKSSNNIFERLCERAIQPFSLSVDDFLEMPSNMICHSQSKGMSRITLPMCDAILVIPLDTKFFTQPHVFSDNCGEQFVINDDTPMFLVKGDTIEFGTFDANELLLVRFLPIRFASPILDKLNLRFSVQFISQAISFARANPAMMDRVDKLLLRKLWKLHMTNRLRFFPGITAVWFSLLFEDSITKEAQYEYLQAIDYSVLIRDQPNMLTAVVCLLAAYFMSETSNGTDGGISRLIEYALASPKKTYAVQLFRQVAAELLNPLRKTMPFRKDHTEFRYLLSSLAIEAYNLSLLANHATILTRQDSIDLPSVFSFNFPGASQVAFVKISPCTDISLLINGVQMTPDCAIEGSSGTIKLARNTTDPAQFAILVVPIFPGSRPHDADLVKLHMYQQKLTETWTESYETIARVMSHIAHKSENAFWLGASPDLLYSIIFPGVDPCVARYRCCLLYLTEQGLDPSWIPQFDTLAIHDLFLDLSSVIWPCQEVEERKIRPMEIYLPTKNAKLSDFFFQLCQAIDNAPIQTLLDLGTSIQSPGTIEVFTMNTIFSQLTDDMFHDGFPVSEEMSPAKLRAYQAFGCVTAAHILSGSPLPVPIAEPVLQYAFGLTQTPVQGLEDQLMAIRMGVFKVELVKPSLRRYAHTPTFARTLRFLPMRPIETVPGPNTEYASFLLGNVIIMPHIKAKIHACSGTDPMSPINVEFVDRLEFDYDPDRNTVTLPCENVWMTLFSQCKPME